LKRWTCCRDLALSPSRRTLFGRKRGDCRPNARRARREIKLFRPILAGRDGNTEFEIDFEESREVAALNQFDTEACYDAREKLRRIEEARIPATHWEPLMGIALDGMEYQEVADRMGIKIGTVKSRVNRAREMINRELEKA
jgi:DNA-directed RNA polymerase specialized sigma24 family protein